MECHMPSFYRAAGGPHPDSSLTNAKILFVHEKIRRSARRKPNLRA
jgi:hypothetical protein